MNIKPLDSKDMNSNQTYLHNIWIVTWITGIYFDIVIVIIAMIVVEYDSYDFIA